MILRQFLHSDPVGISYLVGCGGKALGAVIDPIGEIAPYLRAAEDVGVRIRYVVDTHIHADHASAGRRLAEAAGGEYALFAGSEASPAFRSVQEATFYCSAT
jgi:glyoxylase-like metal-dependent hydrolase (beta-lactamase superfamily II)